MIPLRAIRHIMLRLPKPGLAGPTAFPCLWRWHSKQRGPYYDSPGGREEGLLAEARNFYSVLVRRANCMMGRKDVSSMFTEWWCASPTLL